MLPSHGPAEAPGLTAGPHGLPPARDAVCRRMARAAYLHHGHVLLWRGWLDLAGHLDDGLHQARHVLVYPVVGAVQVGSGRGADFLGLKLPTQKLVTVPLCRGGVSPRPGQKAP